MAGGSFRESGISSSVVVLTVTTPCHICDAPHAQAYRSIQSPFIDGRYTLYLCDTCGSAFFDPNEHAIDLTEFYNRNEFQASAEFQRSRSWGEQVNLLKRLLGRRAGLASVLDIGCRTGDFLLHWEPEHRRVGVELNRSNAEAARKRGLEIFGEQIERLRLQERFSVVSCYAVLEHIPHPRPVLEALGALVKPGGVLAVMIPSYESLLRRRLDKAGIMWHMYSPPGHVSFYSRRFLDGFFERRGFDLAHRYYSSGGMATAYAPWSPGSALLRDGGYQALHRYYTHAVQETPLPERSPLNRIVRGVHHLIVDAAERFTPIGRIPYFDHLYSYYRKRGVFEHTPDLT